MINNGRSYVKDVKRRNSVNFIKTLVELRTFNMINEEVKEALIDAISNPNLKTENIKKTY